MLWHIFVHMIFVPFRLGSSYYSVFKFHINEQIHITKNKCHWIYVATLDIAAALPIATSNPEVNPGQFIKRELCCNGFNYQFLCSHSSQWEKSWVLWWRRSCSKVASMFSHNVSPLHQSFTRHWPCLSLSHLQTEIHRSCRRRVEPASIICR